MNQRFIQLDSLRGLAALAVVFGHMALVPENVGIVSELLFHKFLSPFSIIPNGSSAVILFFVLSGFVLSLPILNGKHQPYSGYLIKRFFRIYVPYIISVLVALVVITLTTKLRDASVTDYVNAYWFEGVSISIIMEHILGIVNVHTEVINIPYWSLVHEMRISIIFPFVVLLLRNVRWIYMIGIGLTLSGIGILNTIYNFQLSNGVMTTYFDSFHFLSFFLYGMLLAKHRLYIIEGFRSLNTRTQYSVLAISFICYNCSYGLITVLNLLDIMIPFENYLRGNMIAIGVVGFIIIALSSSRVGNILKTRIPVFLGNVSYSLYLYHMIIMLALVHGFAGAIPLPYLFLLAFIISVFVAYIAWRYIEVPAMALGKWLANRPSNKHLIHSHKKSDAA